MLGGDGDYNLKPDGGPNISSYWEGAQAFSYPMEAASFSIQDFWKRNKAFQFWNQFSTETQLCLLKMADSRSAILFLCLSSGPSDIKSSHLQV